MQEGKEVVIRPEGPTINAYLSEAWKKRHLSWLFAKRELKVLYSNTYLGVTWSILNPLLTVLILTFVFQRIANIEPKGISAFSSILLAYFVWGMVSNLINHSSQSIYSIRELVHKVYFPRILLIGSGFYINIIESVVILLAFVLTAIFLQNSWDFNLFYLFAGLLFAVMISFGLALCISAIVLRFKDIQYTIPFLLRIGIFITPIGFQGVNIPEKWQWTLYANPVAGPIELLRSGLFDYSIPGTLVAMTVFWALLSLLLGVILLAKIDYRVADLI